VGSVNAVCWYRSESMLDELSTADGRHGALYSRSSGPRSLLDDLELQTEGMADDV
jgi:hypothetical protein